MRMVGVPQQPGVVAVAEHGHPALSERGLEVVFGAAAHLVHLVHEQHAETSHVGRSNFERPRSTDGNPGSFPAPSPGVHMHDYARFTI